MFSLYLKKYQYVFDKCSTYIHKNVQRKTGKMFNKVPENGQRVYEIYSMRICQMYLYKVPESSQNQWLLCIETSPNHRNQCYWADPSERTFKASHTSISE